MTTSSFIEQLKERHPNWKQENGEWYDDKLLYGMGREQYPNAPVVDWPQAGYVTPAQPSEEDLFENIERELLKVIS